MFNINDWYWTTASDNSHVFSSKTGQIVSNTDADYLVWCENNQLEAKLTESYSQLYLYLTKVSSAVAMRAENTLEPHMTPDQVEVLKISNGVDVVSTSTSSLNGTYALDAATIQKMTMIIAGLEAKSDSTTVLWSTNDGRYISFTKPQFLTFQTVISSYLFDVMNTATMLNAEQSASWPTTPLTIA